MVQQMTVRSWTVKASVPVPVPLHSKTLHPSVRRQSLILLWVHVVLTSKYWATSLLLKLFYEVRELKGTFYKEFIGHVLLDINRTDII